jgi:hypothetical protein
MKKAILAVIVIACVLVSACNKTNYVPETFSFKGINYGADYVLGQTGVLIATATDPLNPPNNYNQVSCFFLNKALPTVPGTYTVVSGTPVANQVALSLGLNSGRTIYTSTGAHGTQYVTVSISGGFVTVVGSNITLVNTVLATDTSSTFSLNITQQE